MSTISERIDRLIKELGMNKNSFSKTIGLSNNSTITNIINNPGRTPSYHVIFRIADTFPHVNIRWLISGQGKVFSDGEDSYLDIRDRLAHIHRKYVISLSRAAGLLKVPERDLEQYFYKDKSPSKELIDKYIQAFPDINPEWILHNKSPMFLKGSGVSLMDHGQLADVIHKVGRVDQSLKDLFECVDAKPVHVSRFESILENDIIMEVHNNQMQPEFLKGDLLLCKKILPEKHKPGTSYIIITKKFKVLRTIHHSDQSGQLRLTTRSDETKPVEIKPGEIIRLFAIIGLIRRFHGFE